MDRFTVAVLLFLSAPAWAGNYAECILGNMPGSPNEAFTTAVLQKCNQEFPLQYYGVARGSGITLFRSKTPQQCTMEATKTTVNQRAAGVIAFACRCLYTEALPTDQSCGIPRE